jgi:hypothetical protein
MYIVAFYVPSADNCADQLTRLVWCVQTHPVVWRACLELDLSH